MIKKIKNYSLFNFTAHKRRTLEAAKEILFIDHLGGLNKSPWTRTRRTVSPGANPALTTQQELSNNRKYHDKFP